METITLGPKPPYDIRTHFEHYGSREPQPYVYEDGVYRRAFRLGNGKLVPVEVELNEDVERPNLKARIYSNPTKSEEKEVIRNIKRALGTEHDLRPLYRFMDSDPVLKRVKNNNYGLRAGFCTTVYEGVIITIIQQQISLRLARHMTSLLVRKFGEHIKAGGKEFWEFPSPEKLADATVDELRKCKLSRGKARYIINFSKAVAKGEFDPEGLRDHGREEIIESLTRFNGLGRWTAEMVIVTSIGTEGVNPAGDLGARRAISHFFNKDRLMSEEEVRKFTERWGEYKGNITYYLIAEFLHGR